MQQIQNAFYRGLYTNGNKGHIHFWLFQEQQIAQYFVVSAYAHVLNKCQTVLLLRAQGLPELSNMRTRP